MYTERYSRDIEEKVYTIITSLLLQFGISQDRITLTADFYRDLGRSKSDIYILLLGLTYQFKVVILREIEVGLINAKKVVWYLQVASPK
ncbi:MAG: hypothetical protein RIG62_27895 [Cyclobacteriaceae bacterium]